MTREEVIEVIHKTMYQFFDVCVDTEEVPMSDKDKLLLEVNKAICINISALEEKSSVDAVSRNAIVEMLNAMEKNSIITFDHFIELLYKLPPVEPTPKWISVDKELPKENVWDDGYVEPSDYVLVFGDCGEYGVSRYWGNRKSKAENPNSYKDWMDLDWIAQKPIAWQPLPPSYKGE